MKRRKVLEELNISVSTLDRYMKTGKLRGTQIRKWLL
jgi:predicted site-specific integrase-resolvase